MSKMGFMGFMGFKGAVLGALYCVLRSWQTMLTSGFDVGGFWHYEAVNLLPNGQPYASEGE